MKVFTVTVGTGQLRNVTKQHQKVYLAKEFLKMIIWPTINLKGFDKPNIGKQQASIKLPMINILIQTHQALA